MKQPRDRMCVTQRVHVICVAWRRLLFPYIVFKSCRGIPFLKLSFCANVYFSISFFDLFYKDRENKIGPFTHPSHNLHFLFFSEIAMVFNEQTRKILGQCFAVMRTKVIR